MGDEDARRVARRHRGADCLAIGIVQFEAVLAHQLGDAVRDVDIILAQHVGDRRGADLEFGQGIEIDLVDRSAGGEDVDHIRPTSKTGVDYAKAFAISRRVLAMPNSAMKLPMRGPALDPSSVS